MFRRSLPSFADLPSGRGLAAYFPYGKSHFTSIRGKKQFWRDNSGYLFAILQGCDQHGMFLRPPRFGKSLFMDMMHQFLDVNAEKSYNALFEGTEVERMMRENKEGQGDFLKEHKNKYRVMKFDLSVDVSSLDADVVIERFNNFLASGIEEYCYTYQVEPSIRLQAAADPFAALKRAVSYSRIVDRQDTFILIDEYDRFANKLMFENSEGYRKVVAGQSGDRFSSPVRSLYETIKSCTTVRSFTTGLSPIALADASGANMIHDMSEGFPTLLGLPHDEAKRAIQTLCDSRPPLLSKQDAQLVFKCMKAYVNGYRFSPNSQEVFNPQFCMHFLQRLCKPAEETEDFARRVLEWDPNDQSTALQLQDFDKNSKISPNVIKVLAGNPNIVQILALIHSNTPIQVRREQEFKLENLTTSPAISLPVSFMAWHGLLTPSPRGFVRPNLLVGDPLSGDQELSILGTLFQKSKMKDLSNLVTSPSEDLLWNAVQDCLSIIETPLDNSYSESALQSILEFYFKSKGLHVGAEKPVGRTKRRTDILLRFPGSSSNVLILELKRLRPPSVQGGQVKRDGDIIKSKNNDGDIIKCDPDHPENDGVPREFLCQSAAESRKVVENLPLIQKSWTKFPNVRELEQDAMEQCKSYRDRLKKNNPGVTYVCATLVHVSTARVDKNAQGGLFLDPKSISSTWIAKVEDKNAEERKYKGTNAKQKRNVMRTKKL